MRDYMSGKSETLDSHRKVNIAIKWNSLIVLPLLMINQCILVIEFRKMFCVFSIDA